MINIDKSLFLQQNDNVFVIASGNNSSGKTWFAITLAHALNNLHKKVLLIDANNGLLNIAFQLSLSVNLTMNNIFDDNVAFNQIIYPLNKKNFDVINGQAGGDFLESIPCGKLQLIRDYISVLAHNYDYVIIDTSSSEKIMKHLIPFKSNLILMCSKDPSNLVATYTFLQKTAENNLYHDLQIVVNYASSPEEGYRTYNTLSHACKKYISYKPKLLGVIRHDTRVRDVIRNHTMILSRYPNSEAAEDVVSIAKSIITKEDKNE